MSQSSGSTSTFLFETSDSDLVVVSEERQAKPGNVQDDRDSKESNSLGESDGDNYEEVIWSKGDECMAFYSGEDVYYEACIIQLNKKDGTVKALVKFDGYDSDENEQLELSKIRKRPRKRRLLQEKAGKADQASENTPSQSSTGTSASMFSPLSGRERERDLSAKYSRLEYDRDDFEGLSKISQRLQKRSDSQKKKRAKAAVVSGGEEKHTPKQRDTSTVNKPASPAPSPKVNVSQASRSGQEEKAGDTQSQFNKSGFNAEGFDDSDMEKPNFSIDVAAHLKVPLVLSQSPRIQVPATINQYLREYQRVGVKFLYEHYKNGHGAILGDDMGLGKTVQVIAFLAALLKKTGTREDVLRMKPKFIRQMSDTTKDFEDMKIQAFLIVCPGSVLYNWADELETWGHFRFGCYHLTAKEKTLTDVKKGKLEIVLTTFDTFRENFDELNTYSWNAVVVDEAHKIKGLKAQVTEALRSIRTERRYGLTGTALQNNMTELWALLDWANPNCLGTYSSFSFHYVKRIERGQRQDATKRELAEARKSKEKFSSLRDKWMIRRTKALLADQIPKKDDKVVYCKLPAFQATVYEAILDHEDVKLILSKHKPCPCGSGKNRGSCCYTKNKLGYSMRSLTFSYMHLLLKTANHVALLIPERTTSERQRVAAEEICEVAFAKFPDFVNQAQEASFRTLSDPKYCGKMKVLQGMLSVFKKERSKVLLFSYSTKLLDILEQYVLTKGYEFRRLDGKVNDKKRHEFVREFNRDPDIFLFLISTKAGSLGLNLTGANVVVIFDPNWNPTHDLQAQDRAYRIGQRRDVRVYRLISTGTIEENMYLRQIYKQQLDNVAVGTENARRYFVAVQGDKSKRGELFGIENMFSMRQGGTCLTQDIFERNKKIETALGGVQVSEYLAPEDKTVAQTEDEEKNASEDEISLTPESDLDFEAFEDEDKDSEAEKSSDADGARDGYSDRLTQFTPQGACGNDTGTGSFTELGDEIGTEGSESIFDLFDLFDARKRKPKPKKVDSQAKEMEKSYSDDFGSSKNSKRVEEKGKDSSSAKEKKRELSSLSSDRPKTARMNARKTEENVNASDGFSSFWDNSQELRSENVNKTSKVKPTREIPSVKSKKYAKFSFFPEKSEENNEKTKRILTKNEHNEDYESLMREFDTAIETSKTSKEPKGKKTDNLSIEPKPSTSGMTKKSGRRRRRVVDSSDDDSLSKMEPSPAKSGKFTRIKTSPDEDLDSIGKNCDNGKGKGVGKKSKREKGVGAEDEKSRGEKFKQPVNISLKRKVSDTDGSFSSISDVFNHCNVVHIHENKKVIGASKAEDHMSRCAIQDVFELQQYSQMPAVECDPIVEPEVEEESESEPEPAPKKKKPSKPRKKPSAEPKPILPQTVTVGNKKVLIGQTPKAIQRMHFSRMAKHHGASEADFAQMVVSSTPLEQQKKLRDFYVHEDAELSDVIKDPDEVTDNMPEVKTQTKSVKKATKPKGIVKPAMRKKGPVSSARRGCVYDESDSGSSTDVETRKTKRQSRNKTVKLTQKRSRKECDKNDDSFEDLGGSNSNRLVLQDSDSDSVTGVKVKSQGQSRLKSAQKNVRKCHRTILSSDEEEDGMTTSPVVDTNSRVSSKVKASGHHGSPKPASLLDDLFSASPKRKAPPKKKAFDKVPDQSSIFDIF